MTDIFTKEKRSEIMSLIKGKDTKPELALRKLVSAAFHSKGYRYRKHSKGIPGKPDLAYVSLKIAIFVDGVFWHGYQFKRWNDKLSAEYWRPKIEQNMKRDRKVNRKLKSLGWTVLRFWEHDVKKRPDRVVEKIGVAIAHAVASNADEKRTVKRPCRLAAGRVSNFGEGLMKSKPTRKLSVRA